MRRAPMACLAISLGACTSVTGLDDLEFTPGAGGQTSTGGEGGTPTGGSGGVGGAGVGGLDDGGVIVRYFIDEAASGMPEILLNDAIQPPFNLALDYNTGNMSFVDTATGRGLSWQDEDGRDAAVAPLGSGKVLERLTGKTAATLEAVVDVVAASVNCSRIVSIGDDGESGTFSVCQQSSPPELEIRLNQATKGTANVDLTTMGRVVVHAVFDGEHSAAVERCRLYVSGVFQSNTIDPTDLPVEGETLAPISSQKLTIGNRGQNFQRSLEGNIYYAAVYDTAFTQERVDAHTAVLLENDDAPR